MKYDFGGWATKYNIACSDGRTILNDAFKHCDGMQIPLVWNHNYSGPDSIIGKATLKHADVGVYAYCEFNENETAKTAKNLVIHGDITALSIYANKLKQDGGRVLKGDIKEVSLVLAGANPGASIQEVLAHGENEESGAMIYNDEEELVIAHSDSAEEPVQDEEALVIAHSDSAEDQNGKTVGEVYNSMTEEQKKVVAYIADQLIRESIEEESNMKHNVFEQNQENNEMKHSEILEESLKDAKKYGTLKESILAHAATYGIEDIESLFPEEHALNHEPHIIDNDQSWVAKFLNNTKKSPFSRLKAVHADTRDDKARALGYVKGNLKKEEVFSLLNRVTSPQTVYKKQKLDRDDILDITDFDVVAFMKKEMRMKLEEELARAMLIGDGRDPIAAGNDKIKENHIRPVFNDSDLYTIKAELPTSVHKLGEAHDVIRTVIKAMAEYEGKGQPMMFVHPDLLADMLLIEDENGRFIYENEAVLAKTLRVKEIVPVPLMKGLTRKDKESVVHDVKAIIVNPADYTVGADKGGQVAMFEDFDIDYNQQKYLIETRCSGSLMQPKTAICVEKAK